MLEKKFLNVKIFHFVHFNAKGLQIIHQDHLESIALIYIAQLNHSNSIYASKLKVIVEIWIFVNIFNNIISEQATLCLINSKILDFFVKDISDIGFFDIECSNSMLV